MSENTLPLQAAGIRILEVDGAPHFAGRDSSTLLALASTVGIVTAEVGVLRADSSNVVAGPAGVESNIIRYELPAPSRRR